MKINVNIKSANLSYQIDKNIFKMYCYLFYRLLPQRNKEGNVKITINEDGEEVKLFL